MCIHSQWFDLDCSPTVTLMPATDSEPFLSCSARYILLTEFPRAFASQKCSWADIVISGGNSPDVGVHVRKSESLMHRESHHLNLSVQGKFDSGVPGNLILSEWPLL